MTARASARSRVDRRLVDPEARVEHMLAAGRRLTSAGRPPWEVSLDDAVGRVLARDVVSLLPVPPFTNCAMDGYAVCAADLQHLEESALVLPVTGDVPAGAPPGTLAPGTAHRVMTGAPLPAGADCVVPVELTDQRPGPGPVPDRVRLLERPTAGRHVRRAAEDADVGALVLRAGTRLGPAHVAAAASAGRATLEVHHDVRVLVVATGDELAEPSAAPGAGRVPDSNGPLLAALARRSGARVVARRRSSDDVEELLGILREHAGGIDLVLTSGGISTGAHEVVREALEGRGVDFCELAMRPGSPQGFATIPAPDGREVAVAALPGNPVAAYVSFHVLVRPLLALLAGADPALERQTVPVVAGADWPGRADRVQYAPVTLDRVGDDVVAVPPHVLGGGSHLVASLARADALAVVPPGRSVRTGEGVRALPVDDRLP